MFCILLGVKLTKDDMTGQIKIFDPTKSTNYYIELNIDEYNYFQTEGWKKGVFRITLNKYINKLERIKTSISEEMNGSMSLKKLKYLKESRQQVLKKYYKLIQKLN
tara:strand:- start:686 stop:1003 length:318 start_codon:yes stop_codon:yes gene_type:complete